MTSESRFWDRIAQKYARSPVSDEASYQKKLEITRGFLTPEAEMLEFGCGTGSTAIAHAPYVRHIRATDVSQAMLDIAKGKAESAGITNITFEKANVDELNVTDASLDVVLGMSILHLVSDRDAVLDKVFQMLKPGGRFVSSTACMGDVLALRLVATVAPIGKALGLLPTLRAFTRAQLEDSIRKAGFEIDQSWQPGPRKAVFIVALKPE
jgi:ubiquinone/menaquinone biosynthesis C-methylase UbiE